MRLAEAAHRICAEWFVFWPVPPAAPISVSTRPAATLLQVMPDRAISTVERSSALGLGLAAVLSTDPSGCPCRSGSDLQPTAARRRRPRQLWEAADIRRPTV